LGRQFVRRFRRTDLEGDDFDREMGISTSENIPLGALTVNSANAVLGRKYVASPMSVLRPIFEKLSIHYSDYRFVDFGSGMGRVVLYAARCPFREVIGVEFAAELHAAAQDNVRKTESLPERQAPISLYCMDAAEFSIPDGNLICFFFNPFEAPVMEKVVAHLTESLIQNPRDCMIIYVNPLARIVFDDNPRWTLQEQGEFHVIYQFDSAGAIAGA
jgi:SAM-dependent methyltransferase